MSEDEQNPNPTDSESNNNSSTEGETDAHAVEVESSITDYERQRQSRIAANIARMESLGLQRKANSLIVKTRNSACESKRVMKNKRNNDDDDEYEPNCDVDDDDEDFEEDEETFFPRNRKSNDGKKVKNMKAKTVKSTSNFKDTSVFMDEDEALKQAITLSLEYQQGGPSSNTQTSTIKKKSGDQLQRDNSKTRKRKILNTRVQMTEDDLVIHFCQIDEVGKGAITVRDVQRMAATHDFTWSNEEISDMIRCFDSDRKGKLTLDDFRNIVQRCNMLQMLAAP